MTTLRVDLVGEIHEITPGEQLTFGRSADLVIDTNRYLHRTLGAFTWDADRWWVANLGSAIALEIVDNESPSVLNLAPGSSAPVPFRASRIRFQAGAITYELVVTIDRELVETPPEPTPDTSLTIASAAVSLNDEQRLLLVALGEPRLRSGSLREELPTNREVADRLGWTLTKFNRKLDNLCTKFDRLGVAGIKGDLAGMATSRRERLVNHVITAGIVTVADLERDGDA